MGERLPYASLGVHNVELDLYASGSDFEEVKVSLRNTKASVTSLHPNSQAPSLQMMPALGLTVYMYVLPCGAQGKLQARDKSAAQRKRAVRQLHLQWDSAWGPLGLRVCDRV